jgi:hypothetical protein
VVIRALLSHRPDGIMVCPALALAWARGAESLRETS